MIIEYKGNHYSKCYSTDPQHEVLWCGDVGINIQYEWTEDCLNYCPKCGMKLERID